MAAGRTNVHAGEGGKEVTGEKSLVAAIVECELASEETHPAGSRNEENFQPGSFPVENDVCRLPGHVWH